MQQKTWINISGFLWAAIGLWLLYKGLYLLSSWPNQNEASWWIGGGLLVGFIKGRFILSKTVKRLTSRILSLPSPIKFTDAYPKSYWILLACMMFLGFILRFFPIDWRGFVDVAVGSALLHGALLYFKEAKKASSVQTDHL